MTPEEWELTRWWREGADGNFRKVGGLVFAGTGQDACPFGSAGSGSRASCICSERSTAEGPGPLDAEPDAFELGTPRGERSSGFVALNAGWALLCTKQGHVDFKSKAIEDEFESWTDRPKRVTKSPGSASNCVAGLGVKLLTCNLLACRFCCSGRLSEVRCRVFVKVPLQHARSCIPS